MSSSGTAYAQVESAPEQDEDTFLQLELVRPTCRITLWSRKVFCSIHRLFANGCLRVPRFLDCYQFSNIPQNGILFNFYISTMNRRKLFKRSLRQKLLYSKKHLRNWKTHLIIQAKKFFSLDNVMIRRLVMSCFSHTLIKIMFKRNIGILLPHS